MSLKGKILKKYIANEFLIAFVFSVIALTFITIISQFFEDLRMFIEHKTPINLMILYYLYKTPFIIVETTPISVLLAVLFSLTKLLKTNEISAMKSGGVGLSIISYPLLASSLIISMFVFIFAETIVPYSNIKARETKQAKILDIPISHGILRSNATFITLDDYVLFAKLFDGERGIMDNVSIMKFNNENVLTHRWDAKESVYVPEKRCWELRNGYKRIFSLNELDEVNLPKENAEQFSSIFLYVKETQTDFSKGLRKPQELNMGELYKYIKSLQKSGNQYKEELVNLYLRISFPLANFILCLLGVPIALLTGRKGGLITSFAISLAIGFAYWGFIALGVSFGKNGVLPALLSAWIGNIIFGILGIYLMNVVRKH
jgi:lipopolysaccharide export system permease protein